jgi:DNA-binding XRE family transcriptional regulator
MRGRPVARSARAVLTTGLPWAILEFISKGDRMVHPEGLRVQRDYPELFNVEDYRRRLQLMRAMFGCNQTRFAKLVGVPPKTWNNYERGYPLPRETMWKLRNRLGISAEWIYFGTER